jgi:hypothetical protein
MVSGALRGPEHREMLEYEMADVPSELVADRDDPALESRLVTRQFTYY